MVPLHRSRSVAEQTPQAPLPWQAGVDGEGHGCVPALPLSALHPVQAPAELQVGVLPVQLPSLLAEHCVQLPST